MQGSRERASAGIRRPYLRVVGIEVDSEGPGRASQSSLTAEEEEEMRQLAARPDIQDLIAKSIAPSIYGGLGRMTTPSSLPFSVTHLCPASRHQEGNCLTAVRRL